MEAEICAAYTGHGTTRIGPETPGKTSQAVKEVLKPCFGKETSRSVGEKGGEQADTDTTLMCFKRCPGSYWSI